MSPKPRRSPKPPDATHGACPSCTDSARPQLTKGRSSKAWSWLALAVILALAAFLRFDGITQVGIRYWDEAYYTCDARLWHRCAVLATDGNVLSEALRGDKQAVQDRMDEVGVDFAEATPLPAHGYTFLASMMMFVVGDCPAAMLVTNALCGTLTVLVLYGLGVVLFNRPIALWAALILAVSPYHLAYSRNALTESSAGLFIMLGILLWAYGRVRGWSARTTYGLCGLALGYAMLCKWRHAYIPAVLMVVDLLANRHEAIQTATISRPPTSLTRKCSWLAAGCAVPVLATEALFRGVLLAAWLTDSWLPVPTFLDTLWRTATEERDYGFSVPGRWPVSLSVAAGYAGYFLRWHGIAAGVLLLVGLVAALRRRGVIWIVPAIVAVPFVMLMFQRHVLARVMAPSIPAACLCLAVGVYWIAAQCGRLTGSKPTAVLVATGLLAVVLVPASVEARHLCQKRSELADACVFLASRGENKVLAPRNLERYTLYLDSSDVAMVSRRDYPADSPTEVLDLARRDGVRWVVTDPQCWHFNDANHEEWRERQFRWWLAMDEELRHNARLVAEFRHLSDYRWEFLAEGPGLASLGEMTEKDGGPLRIYEIQPTTAQSGQVSPTLPLPG